jgi:hypothetical protein
MVVRASRLQNAAATVILDLTTPRIKPPEIVFDRTNPKG